MSGDVHVRFCEGVGVGFPRATRLVLGFELKRDAERVYRVLGKRLGRYGLELHPEKTRIIRFGPGADEEARRQGGCKPPTFDFLGLTHISGRTRKGRFGLLVRTVAKRLRRSIRAVKHWCKANRHRPVKEQHARLTAVLRGHYAYYGRRMNYQSLQRFYEAVRRAWRYWLNRRDERRHLSWERFAKLLERYSLPPPRIRELPLTQYRLNLGSL